MFVSNREAPKFDNNYNYFQYTVNIYFIHYNNIY